MERNITNKPWYVLRFLQHTRAYRRRSDTPPPQQKTPTRHKRHKISTSHYCNHIDGKLASKQQQRRLGIRERTAGVHSRALVSPGTLMTAMRRPNRVTETNHMLSVMKKEYQTKGGGRDTGPGSRKNVLSNTNPRHPNVVSFDSTDAMPTPDKNCETACPPALPNPRLRSTFATLSNPSADKPLSCCRRGKCLHRR